MSKVQDITRENWIMSTFPEWGRWLNEEIEMEKYEERTAGLQVSSIFLGSGRQVRISQG